VHSKLTHLALVFAILALAVSAYSLTREGGASGDESGPSAMPQQLADIEKRVDRLAHEFEEFRGLTPELLSPVAGGSDVAGREAGPGAGEPSAPEDRLKALVDVAVEEKARKVTEKLRLKADRKPSIETFAKVLELTGEQRDAVEQEVIRGQGVVFGILETPTADGRNLLDDFVELYASSVAKQGEDPGWGKWFVRVVSEKVPGTDQTYGTRIEAEKASMRGTFRRIFSKEQYGEFEGWRVDPVEIRGIVGSPGEALGLRITERAKEMGAEIPEEDGK
jgi:hypothetical protein